MMSKITKIIEDGAYSVYAAFNKDRKDRERKKGLFSKLDKSITDYKRNHAKIK